jgi:hypothetical protein
MTLRQWLASGSSSRKVVWWRPSLREVLRQAGWCWLALVLPISVAGAISVAAFIGGRSYLLLWWVGLRLTFIALAIPFLLWDHLKTKVYKARQDPFCIHCGYTVMGLPEEGKCPECGRPYRMSVIQMFRHDPQWVMAHWRFNGRPPSVERFLRAHPRAQLRCAIFRPFDVE